jgi:DNA-binding winged helix-turn-helix (wHTH) protein
VPVRFENCTFDSEKRELTRDDVVEHLSPKAFRLLEVLLERRPNAVSRKELHELLWPSSHVEDATLNGLVAEVRGAIGDSARTPRLVRTIPVFGYAFSGAAMDVPAATAPPGRTCHVFWLGRRFDLNEGENVLGRGSDSTVWLDDDTVSRRHAVIRIDASGNAELVDLGSKNGTILHGRRLRGSETLEDGEEFLLGSVALRFRRSGDAVSTRSAHRSPRGPARPR